MGRRPDLSCIGNSGVAIERGRVVVDAEMRTNLPGVFAPGDLNGRKMLAHAAFAMGEAAARASRADPGIGVFPFAANGRAVASGDTEGFVKVIVDPRFGEILGVHIVGRSASEIINEAAILMRMEVTAFEIVEVAHAHPTRSEAFMEAVAAAIGRCIHLPPKG